MSKGAQLGRGGSGNLTSEQLDKALTNPEGGEFPCVSSTTTTGVNGARESWGPGMMEETFIAENKEAKTVTGQAKRKPGIASVHPAVLVRQERLVTVVPVGRKCSSQFGGKRMGSRVLSSQRASFLPTGA